MWYLVSATEPDKRYVILGDKKYVVGRMNCDIIINDGSVSRKQAIITMAHYETNVVKSFVTPTLSIQDISKFGTFVNGNNVNKTTYGGVMPLKHGDEIKFGGTPASVFKAVYEPFISTTSCLEKSPKKSLQKVICLLGGHLVRDWRDSCDLLIMSQINVTVKVICAINKLRPIVTPLYLDHVHTHLLGNRDKPDPADYLPEVVDKEVPPGVSFHPDLRRQTLLEGLKFYFLSATQFNKTNLAVSTAGGLPILLEDGTEEDAEAMTEDGTIVVSISRDVLASLSPCCQKFFRLVLSVLRRKKLRMITDPEIGWAILTCNIEDFCNPKSEIIPSMYSSMASQSLTQMESFQSQSVCVPDTQKRSVPEKERERLSRSPEPSKRIKLEFPPPPEYVSQMPGDSSEKAAHGFSALGVLLEEEKPAAPDEIKPNAARVGPCSDDSSPSRSPLYSPTSYSYVSKVNSKKNESVERKDKRPKGLDSSKEFEEGNSGFSSVSQGHVRTSVGLASSRDKRKRKDELISETDSAMKTDCSTGDTSWREESSLVVPQKSVSKRLFLPIGDDSDDDKDSNHIVNKRVCGNSNLFPGKKDSNKDNGKRKILSGGKTKVQRGAKAAFDNLSDEQEQEDGVTDVPESMDVRDDIDANRTEPVIDEGTDWGTRRPGREEEERDIKPDIKTDPDVLLDDAGRPVRNVCEVKFVDLVARNSESMRKKQARRTDTSGVKNFKKFKKTQHAGAGSLPTIIGGRDLEVYMGSKHKDVEDILSMSLAREKTKKDEEKKDDDLFNWTDEDLSKGTNKNVKRSKR